MDTWASRARDEETRVVWWGRGPPSSSGGAWDPRLDTEDLVWGPEGGKRSRGQRELNRVATAHARDVIEKERRRIVVDCVAWTEVGGGDERGEVEWSWGRKRAGGDQKKGNER
ncbi:hypothetical protein NL676_025624 [Syzygium grande]|nr:hypothetical protein NL676_025624 [Syzygium grande]